VSLTRAAQAADVLPRVRALEPHLRAFDREIEQGPTLPRPVTSRALFTRDLPEGPHVTIGRAII
jgi:hypothetical protein